MRLYRSLRLALLAACAAALLPGCGATLNVVSEGGDDKLMLGGFCARSLEHARVVNYHAHWRMPAFGRERTCVDELLDYSVGAKS